MPLVYNFDNLADVAEYFGDFAARKRTEAETVKGVHARSEKLAEATVFEYCQQVVENSNLVKGRFILVDEDLAEALDEVNRARDIVDQTVMILAQVRDQIDSKIVAMKTHPQAPADRNED